MANTKFPNGIEGPLTGDVTGNVTGNVTGAITGNITGDVTGNTTGTHTGAVVGFASKDTPTTIAGDGAITVASGTIRLTKGSAAAITIVAPTTPAQDNIIIDVYSTTAQAHVITCASDGFNAKGSSGTATFSTDVGNFLRLRADTGHWLAIIKTGVTVA